MWTLEVLSGPLRGKRFQLNEGSNIIGRAPQCDIVMGLNNVSKKHLNIEVYLDKVLLTDQKSRNGTFVNGKKISRHRYKIGDQISLDSNKVAIMPAALTQASGHTGMSVAGSGMPVASGNTALDAYGQEASFANISSDPMAMDASEDSNAQASPPSNPVDRATEYIEDVLLPGIYKLPEILEFKTVLYIFMGLFILFVTALSSLPLMTILKSSIEKESQRRALTIARTMATVNRPAIEQGIDSTLSTDIARREPGVDKAFIIDAKQGLIKSPAFQAGEKANIAYVPEGMKKNTESFEQITSSNIVAMVPIEVFDPQSGGRSINSWSVVLYNMGTLAVDDSRTLSLFIQTFAIALIVGFILFYLLFKLIEFPFKSLNKQMNSALRDGHDQVEVNFQFEEVTKLASNISTTLNRALNGQGNDGQTAMEYDRYQEIENLIHLIGFPALAIRAVDRVVTSMNSALEEKTGLSSSELMHNQIDNISDQALKLNLIDLVDRSNSAPDQMATNQLEFAGVDFEITAQAVYGTKEIAYFIVVLLPEEGADE